MITLTIMAVIIVITEKKKKASCTMEALGQLSGTERNSRVGGNSSPGGGQWLVQQPKLFLGPS